MPSLSVYFLLPLGLLAVLPELCSAIPDVQRQARRNEGSHRAASYGHQAVAGAGVTALSRGGRLLQQNATGPAAGLPVAGVCGVLNAGWDYGYPSGNMAEIPNTSPADCCELCQQRPDCGGWAWLYGLTTCYLKPFQDPDNDLPHGGDIWIRYTDTVSGTRDGMVANPGVCPGQLVSQKWADTEVSNLTSLSMAYPELCCEACAADPKCNRWAHQLANFVPANGTCYLLSAAANGVNATLLLNQLGWISGTRQAPAPNPPLAAGPCGLNVGWGWGNPDSSINSTQTEFPEDCCAACQKVPACAGWRWEVATQNCTLVPRQDDMPKSLTFWQHGSTQGTTGMVSGNRAGQIAPSRAPCNLTVSYRWMDLAQSYANVSQGSPNACCAACGVDPKCARWVYQLPTDFGNGMCSFLASNAALAQNTTSMVHNGSYVSGVSPVKTSAAPSSSSSSPSAGTIAGVVVGGVVGLIAVLALLSFILIKRGYWPCKRSKQNQDALVPAGKVLEAHPPIPGIVQGDPFLKGSAWQFTWTDYQPTEQSVRVEAGITDHHLDTQLAPDGSCQPVELRAAEVKQQIEVLTCGLLGRGGAALVFMCRWPARFGPNALLAIKVLKDAYDAPLPTLQSFEYEARLLSAIRHPNVLRLYGYCLELPCVCLIMELMPASLEALLYPEEDLQLPPGLRAGASSATNSRWWTTGMTRWMAAGAGAAGPVSGSLVSGSTAHNTDSRISGLTPTAAQAPVASAQIIIHDGASIKPPAAIEAAEPPDFFLPAPPLDHSKHSSVVGSQAAPDHTKHSSAVLSQAAPSEPLTMLQVLSISADVAAGLAYLHSRYIDQEAGLGPSGGSGPAVPLINSPHSSTHSAAWQQGEAQAGKIVHRDLKPGNVLISSEGRAKLSDFGLARMNPTTTVHTMHVGAGTLAYMAPELLAANQAYAIAPTNRCDIYSMGVMMWEMLARRKPWHNMGQAQIIASVCQGMRPAIPNMDISSIDEEAPISPAAFEASHTDWVAVPASFDASPQLVAIIQKCWRQREHKRPPATEVHAMLQRMLTHAQRTSSNASELPSPM